MLAVVVGVGVPVRANGLCEGVEATRAMGWPPLLPPPPFTSALLVVVVVLAEGWREWDCWYSGRLAGVRGFGDVALVEGGVRWEDDEPGGAF